ncbi:MAG: hypothetical protein GEV03_08330 [Streptosporangiales bacterium]|nr:hypothetical protein [Streptosporangiales bacterium]
MPGCDDMTFSGDRPPYALVDREAPTCAEAMVSAIRNIESVGDLRVVKVEADPLVSTLDIAERLGITREAVRLATNGKVRGGGFPVSALSPNGRHRLWRWSDVAAWYGVDTPRLLETIRAARAVNAWLELRAVVPSVAPDLGAVAEALQTAA